MKQLCHIPVRGEACTLCKKTNRSCTFVDTPSARRRGSGRSSNSSTIVTPNSTGISSSLPILVSDAIGEQSVEQSSITAGGGASVEPRNRSKALGDFMDCLASEDQPQVCQSCTPSFLKVLGCSPTYLHLQERDCDETN